MPTSILKKESLLLVAEFAMLDSVAKVYVKPILNDVKVFSFKEGACSQ
jgi:hypothetical protein